MVEIKAQKNPNSDSVNVSVSVNSTRDDIIDECGSIFEGLVKTLKKHDADLAFMIAASIYIRDEIDKIKNPGPDPEPSSYTSTLS